MRPVTEIHLAMPVKPVTIAVTVPKVAGSVACVSEIAILLFKG